MDMYDDCLLSIFKHLSPHALNAIAFTCTRLHHLARCAFKSKDANKLLDLTTTIKVHSAQPQPYIESFLRNFGDLIKQIDWITDAPPNESLCSGIVSLLATYCSGGTLEQLRMNGIAWRSSLANESADDLFRHLKSIHFKNSRTDNDSNIIELSKGCREIVVHQTSFQELGAVLGRTCLFPDLEKLSITIRCVDLNKQLHRFLERHQEIKHLKLKFDRRERATNVFDLAAVLHCRQLEFLDVDGYRFKFNGATVAHADLPNLKYLRITDIDGSTDVEHFVHAAASLSLQHLAISVRTLLRCLALKTADTFRNLRALILFDDDRSMGNISLMRLNKLKNLMKIELLCLRPDNVHYLNYLGSADTLTELTLTYGTIDNATIEGLCRLTRLRVLKLRDVDLTNVVHHISDVHWAMLQRNNTLARLEYSSFLYVSCLPFLTLFLLKLGSTETLEWLTFDVSESFDVNDWKAVGRYHNLRVLEMRVRKCSSQINIFLKIVQQLQRLEQLKIFNECVTWEQILHLIEAMPNLRTIKGMGHIDLATYNALIEIGERLNKKLAIELIGSVRLAEIPIGLLERNRHVVDIYYETREVFNEFDY